MEQSYAKLKKITDCIPHITFALLFCSSYVEINATELSNSGQLPSTSQPNTISIDLSQCLCTSHESPCELSIIKSPLLEINCLIGENMCCPFVRATLDPPALVDTKNETINPIETEANIATTTNVNVKIYPIKPMIDDLESRTSPDQIILGKQKPKKKCLCKARSSCPHKYIDYGFGFHCTYNTVRCCIPEDDSADNVDKQPFVATNATTEENALMVNNENDNHIASQGNPVQLAPTASSDQQPDFSLNGTTTDTEAIVVSPNSPDFSSNPQPENGELLITEVTNLWKYDDDTEKDGDCFCLPIQKCRARLETNNIERRRDTLCPGDMIQCCGGDVMEEITKKKDDNNDDITDIKPEYSPYHQPIQLPGPLVSFENETENPEIVAVPQTPTIPPPQLPTQYHSYEPNNYNRGYNYPPNSYPGQLSGPQNYQKGLYGNNGQNIRPWVSLSSPSTYSKYPPVRNDQQGYPRGPYPNEARSSKPGGLFDTLASMLG